MGGARGADTDLILACKPGRARAAGRGIGVGGVGGGEMELILAGGAGQARAWDRLVAKYERLVFSIPRSYGLSREDAADVSQATFIALVGGLNSLTEESNVKAWLATVARRHTWRLMERGRREGTEREDDLAETPWLLGNGKPPARGGARGW